MKISARKIIESIPMRFRPEKARDYHAVFHFKLSGDEPIEYTAIIQDGQCRVFEGLEGEADCVVRASSSVYVDLETGKLNPQTALLLNKVKVSNLAAMMQFVKCFRRFDEQTDYEHTLREHSLHSLNYRERPRKEGPLAGVTILDFTRLLPGPLATMFLADLGAEVIKIEDPDSPDYIRSFEPAPNGVSLFYLSLNRNKRSLALNYLTPEGKKVIEELVKKADVLIEQFRPGVMAKLGLGYEALAAINSKLIYVSVSGYGQSSPLYEQAGHDLNYLALSGALSTTGDGEQLYLPGFQAADIAGGAYMAMNAVTTALYHREKTGRGDWIDLSMTDGVLPLSVLQFAYYQGSGSVLPAGSFELSGGLPNYNVYCCADGKHIALGSLEPKFWTVFCRKAQKPEWEARIHKSEDRRQLKEDIADFFKQKTREEWLVFFRDADVCLTPVLRIDELCTHPYWNERKMFLENEHTAVGKYHTINQPLKFKQTFFENNWSAPDLGDDSAMVLKELNYSEAEVAALVQKGVVKLNV